jgi:hypothetical protein
VDAGCGGSRGREGRGKAWMGFGKASDSSSSRQRDGWGMAGIIDSPTADGSAAVTGAQFVAIKFLLAGVTKVGPRGKIT